MIFNYFTQLDFFKKITFRWKHFEITDVATQAMKVK